MKDVLINADDPKQKALLLEAVRTLKGMVKVTLVKFRNTRSYQQNRYLWGVVYPAVADGLLECYGEWLTVEEVHCLMKQMFLSRPLVDRDTGDTVGCIVRHTPQLDTAEFSHYIEAINKFAAETLSMVIPSATIYRSEPC